MGEHLAHGISAQAEDPGCLPDAHAGYHAGSSDAQIQFHLVHLSHLPRGRVVPYGKWQAVQFSSAVYRRSSRLPGALLLRRLQNPLHMLYGISYNVAMYTILRSATFDRWLSRLRDRQAVNRIVARLLAAEDGHLGDVRSVGNGVSEMRIQYGPGYRVYFITRGAELIVLLSGGDKDSQRGDIGRAKRMATEWRS